ncbi:MAG: YggT family protein [Gammaproteobacteria bacterium]|jgi:YggT family protein|nr:YggT family protein [Pseudomonadota bacterium]NCX10710.1 YggT family protein [Pseudomonadota bacterium]NCX24163.1 YggT family protein [Pseudomonadota bacterium]NCX29794.1 YggT family protein [Pseudomonadota bacterium]NCX33966.1 YggT family protein [Pseudomonadota bacterium]|tara:strand:+ start:1584 stop:2096 length:513 start_codon:yes stop_codon:yes gene_type:complete
MSGLLGIVFSILSYVFIILFVFNLLKIDYYNPIVKAFLNFYKPISLISIFSNQIYTIFLVAVILKFSGFYILYSSQYDHYVLGIVSVIEVINTTLTIFFFSIIGAVILSWVAPNSPNPILKIIEEISDKLLAPIRKFIPALGGLDFSPIFALILIRQLEIFLASIVRSII